MASSYDPRYPDLMDVTFLSLLALLSLLAWIWLLLLRGGFWRCDQIRGRDVGDLADWPSILAVIPARDEAETIAASVRSLVQQDYPGELLIVVVDDGSSDDTAALVRDLAPSVEVLTGAPLPENWTGKMWAVAQGVEHGLARQSDARYILLTDADIGHGPDSLRWLVAKAEAGGLDLVSLMVRLRCRTVSERLLIPAFVFFFQKLYPFSWVNNPARKTAAAAGGCMLVRRAALRRIGGISRLRDRVIDDCALAAAIKPGGPIWLGLADDSVSLRGYDGVSGIWNMVARTAFVQLRNSGILLFLSLIGMALIYLLPPAALIVGASGDDQGAMVFGAAGWAVMAVSLIPVLRFYGQPSWLAILAPVIATFYGAMTLASAIRTWRGAGARWKGRSYPG
jgi:hopene-associated glycosyltransferase HpnB